MLAGAVEVSVGSTIRPWIGNKNDPTRLGFVTIVLAAIAVSSAVGLAVSRRPVLPSRRLGLAVGMLVPGLLCFTTVGRLWYVPGVLVLTGGVLAAYGVRSHLGVVGRDINRNATRILAFALGVLSLGLGIAALGSTGVLGVVGALVVLNLLVVRPRVNRPAAIVLLLVATAPFAITTWWSVVTPLVAVLIVIFGSVAMTARRAPDALVEVCPVLPIVPSAGFEPATHGLGNRCSIP